MLLNSVSILVGSYIFYVSFLYAEFGIYFLGLTNGSYEICVALLGCINVFLKKERIYTMYKYALWISFIIYMITICCFFCRFKDERFSQKDQMITTMRLSIDFNRYKKFWDDTQRNEECCGIVDAHDWMKFGGFNNTLRVPRSCCRT